MKYKKYRVDLVYNSGCQSSIEVNTKFEADVIIEAFREEYNINQIYLLVLDEGKWELLKLKEN